MRAISDVGQYWLAGSGSAPRQRKISVDVTGKHDAGSACADKMLRWIFRSHHRAEHRWGSLPRTTTGEVKTSAMSC